MKERQRIVVAFCLAILWTLGSTLVFVIHIRGALTAPDGRNDNAGSSKRTIKYIVKRKWRNTWRKFGFYQEMTAQQETSSSMNNFSQLAQYIVNNTNPDDVESPPFGYPWWGDNATSVKPLSRDAIASLHETWEQVVIAYTHKNFTPGQRPLAYVIHDGQLYGSTAQLEHLNDTDPGYYAARIQTFHEMILSALEIGRAHHAPLFNSSSSKPVPILLDDRDFRDCLDKRYPRMTYAMVAPEKRRQQRQDKCIALAIPGYDPWYLALSRGFLKSHDWDEQFRRWRKDYPWKTKFREAVWRGSSTGPVDNSRWQRMPRARLVQNSLERPDLFDAAFTAIVQRNDINMSQTRMANGIQFEDFMKYRAVMDIDGNSWSSRFEALMCQNSVVIKVEPKWSGYSFGELKPWKHYVPIDANMTNITDIVAYVVSDEHADEMQAIIRRANAWCREKMTATRMALDVFWILVSYAELLTDGHDKDWSRQWIKHIEKKELGLDRIEVE